MPSDLRYKPEGRTLLYGHTDVDIGMKVRGTSDEGNDQWNILKFTRLHSSRLPFIHSHSCPELLLSRAVITCKERN